MGEWHEFCGGQEELAEPLPFSVFTRSALHLRALSRIVPEIGACPLQVLRPQFSLSRVIFQNSRLWGRICHLCGGENRRFVPAI